MPDDTIRSDFRIGEQASLSKTITDPDVFTLAELVGDFNPIHLDDEYARKSRFGRRIAHGVFSAGLISAVLGNKLPGPVYIGDTITATVEVLSWRSDKRIITLKTNCHNQDNKQVVTGQAVLMVPNSSQRSERR